MDIQKKSGRDKPPKFHMTKSNKHIGKIYNPALQTLSHPLGNITEVNNVTYATALSFTRKVGIKRAKRLINRVSQLRKQN